MIGPATDSLAIEPHLDHTSAIGDLRAPHWGEEGPFDLLKYKNTITLATCILLAKRFAKILQWRLDGASCTMLLWICFLTILANRKRITAKTKQQTNMPLKMYMVAVVTKI